MHRFLPLLVAALVGAAACGNPDGPGRSAIDSTIGVPAAVTESATVIAAAARDGDPERVASLAAEGFEFDISRPDVTLVEHLVSNNDGELLGQLEALLKSDPARRLSPFGNGTVQELWVYPALALESASEWTEADIDESISNGLFSADALAEYRAADAYLGFSIGLTPEGEWVYFTSGRVARTPS